MKVAEAVGRGLVAAGVDHVFGVVGSGNFHVTNAMIAAGARFIPAAHEGGAAALDRVAAGAALPLPRADVPGDRRVVEVAERDLGAAATSVLRGDWQASCSLTSCR